MSRMHLVTGRRRCRCNLVLSCARSRPAELQSVFTRVETITNVDGNSTRHGPNTAILHSKKTGNYDFPLDTIRCCRAPERGGGEGMIPAPGNGPGSADQRVSCPLPRAPSKSRWAKQQRAVNWLPETPGPRGQGSAGNGVGTGTHHDELVAGTANVCLCLFLILRRPRLPGREGWKICFLFFVTGCQFHHSPFNCTHSNDRRNPVVATLTVAQERHTPFHPSPSSMIPSYNSSQTTAASLLGGMLTAVSCHAPTASAARSPTFSASRQTGRLWRLSIAIRHRDAAREPRWGWTMSSFRLCR